MSKLTPVLRDLFLKACLGEAADERLGNSRVIVASACRYCGEPLTANNIVATTTYAWRFVAACHRECKIPGEKRERDLCRANDRNCSNCRHFERIKNMPGISVGRCLNPQGAPLFSAETIHGQGAIYSYPQDYEGHECFEAQSGCGYDDYPDVFERPTAPSP